MVKVFLLYTDVPTTIKMKKITNQNLKDRYFPNNLLNNSDYVNTNKSSSKLCEVTFQLIFKEIFKHKFFGNKNVSSKNLEILLMYKAVACAKKNLRVYKNIDVLTLVNMCIKQFDYFYKNNIKVKDIYDLKSKVGSNLLKSKLNDIALLFKLHNSILNKSRIKSKDKYLLSLRYLKSNNIFKNFVIALDDTEHFNRSEISLFKVVLKQSRNLHVILNQNDSLEFKADPSFTDILDFAKKERINIKYTNNINNLSSKMLCYKMTSLHNELEFICQTIKKYILREEYKEDDIIIFIKDVSTYSSYLKLYLKDYGINYSCWTKEKVLADSRLIKTILSLFKIISKEEIITEYILDYLKNGLTNISKEDIYDIEYYVKKYGASSKEWLNGFKRLKNTNKDNNFLERINKTREEIIVPILVFKKEINKSSDIRAYIYAIHNFIENSGVNKNLKSLILKLKDEEFRGLVKRQISTFLQIMEDMIISLNDTHITQYEFLSLFSLLVKLDNTGEKYDDFLNSVKVVSIDDIKKLKDSFKVAFILGATDEFFPKIPNKLSDFFNNSEITCMKNLGYNLNEDIETKIQIENLKLKKIFNLVKEKIYITYPQFNLNGEVLRPAWFIKDAKFVDDFYKTEDILSAKSVYKLYSRNIKGEIKLNDAFIRILNNDSEYKNTINVLKNYKPLAYYSLKKPEALACLLCKDDKTNINTITLSPSQIESYYSCAFKFLCRYVLNLDLLDLETFDSLKYGSLIHYVLENIFKKYYSEEILNFNEDKLENIVLKIVNDYVSNSLSYLNLGTKRLENLIKRAIRVLIFSIRHIAKGLINSDFVAKFFELKIGKDIKPLTVKIDDLRLVNIIGKIDRLDIFKVPNKETSYFRIIDYKTGKKEFKLLDLLYGINIQMLIYAICILENKKFLDIENIKFSGALYMPVRGKVVISNRKNSYSDEYICLEKQKKFRMNGIILKNLTVAKAMEKDINGIYIPVVLKNDELKGNENNLLSEDQVNLVFKYVEYLIKNAAKKIYESDFTPNPLKGDIYDSCEYCEYRSICGIDYKEELEVDIKNKDIDEIYNEISNKLFFN